MLRNNLLVIVLISTWLIFAVIFGIFDLEISKEVVNQNSGWAKFLEDYGMIPGLIVILGGIFIYYSHLKVEGDLLSWFIKVVFYLATSGLILYLFDIIFSNNVDKNFVFNHLLIFIITSFVISIFIFTLIHFKIQVLDLNKIIFAKIVVGTAFFGYIFCIQLIKTFWGRIRFRELNATFSQFTPWYLPQGITGFDSFPSGHAAMGFILLPLIILFTKKSWQKNLLIIIILIWGFVLALSRVIVGAHYASDVLFGSFFIVITFLFFYKRYSRQAGN